MRTDCDVIRDLLPLYAEDMVSEKSKEIIEEHLAECEACGKIYRDLSAEDPKVSYDREPAESFRRYVKREKVKTWLKAFLSVVLLFALGVFAAFAIPAGLIGAVTLPLWISHVTEGAENYNREDLKGYSGFLIFPEQVDEEQISEYYYFYLEGLFDADVQVYLQCVYSPEEYAQECERLAAVHMTYENERHGSRYNTTDYMLPAYETIQSVNHTYEYALLDEQNCTIDYIFLQFIPREKLEFAEEKLPYGYERDRQVDQSLTQYNMYAFPVTPEDYEEEGYRTVYE